MKKFGSYIQPGQYVGLPKGNNTLILGGPSYKYKPGISKPKYKPGQLVQCIGVNQCKAVIVEIKRYHQSIGYREYECREYLTQRLFRVREENIIYIPPYNNIWNELNGF